MIGLSQIAGFDWDEGNARKSAAKHEVSQTEAEEVFGNAPLLSTDPVHSDAEPRFRALGVTNSQRALHVTFTLRRNETLIRVISARPMSRKERKEYEENS